MKEKYIKLLGNASETANHELIEECLTFYGVVGTFELTEEQLKDFCRMKGLV